MTTKSEKTAAYIIETVAPIFNKNGYAATSIADVTQATGLTKGAIYGNFKNKEELAIASFKFMVKRLLNELTNHMKQSQSPIEKLLLIADFYRNYSKYTDQMGGCPILNVGVDANNQNTLLLEKVRTIIQRIQDELATLIEAGIAQGEISTKVNAKHTAKRIDTMIQGAIFMSYTMNDDFYIQDTMNQIDDMINHQLRA